MMRQPEPYEWVSVHEASRRLSKSVSTIRRMIEAGELVGEREPLGGSRDRYRVRLPVETPQDASGDASPSESPNAPPEASATPQDAPGAIAGLLELVAAEREERVRLTATLVEQAETIGRLRAEREQALADTAAARAELARLTEAREQAARSWLARLLRR